MRASRRDGPIAIKCVVGPDKADRVRLRHEFNVMTALAPKVGPFRVPRPVAMNEDMGIMEMEYLAGAPITRRKYRAELPFSLVQSALEVYQLLRRMKAAPFVGAEFLRVTDCEPAYRAEEARVRSLVADTGNYEFAHGDFLPQNLLRLVNGTYALIDWEWAGAYPPFYDLATLLVGVSGMPQQATPLLPWLSDLSPDELANFLAAVVVRVSREEIGIYSRRTARDLRDLARLKTAALASMRYESVSGLRNWSFGYDI